MSYEKRPLTQAVLAVVAQRLLLKSATELFHTVAAAQPAQHKRRRATDQQMDSFINDVHASAPELAADQVDELRGARQHPSRAQLDSLRVLLDMKPLDIGDHPGLAVRLPVGDDTTITAWTTGNPIWRTVTDGVEVREELRAALGSRHV